MQGCLMASAIVPMLIGFTGIVGVLTKFIGPLTYLIAIVIAWAFCLFLTVFDLVEAGGPARVDIPHKVNAIRNSAWLAVPYPGSFSFAAE
ncbi:hypothetical protein TELCIR_04893 [Teladorsagia circumcincta]|uniref:Uncharacterized protein n=1 Tax=Teladorsagia circumcincta TaxID=45464 RepID=A0A2G9USN1_TELCI|nr:hypothetical protein TELCIR_04893 [Teladorsagia circumcincta]